MTTRPDMLWLHRIHAHGHRKPHLYPTRHGWAAQRWVGITRYWTLPVSTPREAFNEIKHATMAVSELFR